ncbi:hypothetical protein RHMOL_Rhmol11G0221000 [Rhododendron molle]|uniref:Uncharacterized protein n=1 Tax=Rhododendron molle TaxID=49168 RepID=A0ACC0LV39_RHOML|nr:hypothetical protein RHMOL_Rhmol11G0221000 [Rhododendron molle]
MVTLFDAGLEEVSLIFSAYVTGCCIMTLTHSTIRSYVADGSGLVFGNFWTISAAGVFVRVCTRAVIIALLIRYISGHFSVLLLGDGYCKRGSICRRWIYRVLNQSVFGEIK